MIAYYAIDYRSPYATRETVTIYAYGSVDAAGVSFTASDPLVNVEDATNRVMLTADRFDIADAYAARIADLILHLIPGATLTVRQGDDIPV